MNSFAMAWRVAFGNFLRSGTVLSLVGGVTASGSYVMYKDYSRYHRMLDVFSSGNILPPFAENHYEISFFRRKEFEILLRQILGNSFSNEYYLINGEVGTGKTRLIVEIVRDMMSKSGAKKLGAPVYVSVSQGKSFADSLASAVNFFFDEHVSYKFFLDFVMRINSFPRRDEDSKLTRVLNAIEEASFMYLQLTGHPVVLVIDGANGLQSHQPGALEKIQDKAKLWADTNTVKVIFINNDEDTEQLLHKNSSSWSRAGTPITVDDLTREDAIEFLMTSPFLETSVNENNRRVMSSEDATRVVNLVGGRIVHLVTFKRDFVLGKSIKETEVELKDREREKFVQVSRNPSTWLVVSTVRKSPSKRMKLSKAIKATSQHDVEALIRQNIIRYERDEVGVLIKFQSSLTEKVVEEMENSYIEEKKRRQMIEAEAQKNAGLASSA